MSLAVVLRPSEKRTAPIAQSSGRPRATRTCDGSTWPAVQAEHDRLGLDVAERDVGGAGQALDGMTIEAHIGDPLPYAIPEEVPQRRHAYGFLRHVAAAYLDGLAQPDDPGHVLGAGAPPA